MDQTKSFEEKYAEIQKKLQAAIGGIISDIAKTDDGLDSKLWRDSGSCMKTMRNLPNMIWPVWLIQEKILIKLFIIEINFNI